MTRNKTSSTSNKSGFTLIELVIALSVLSFILMLGVYGFVQVLKMYSSSLALKNTQRVARGAMEEMVREIRYQGGIAGLSSDMLCVETAGNLVSYRVDDNRRLYRYSGISDCNGSNNPVELTASNTRVAVFEPVEVKDSSGPNAKTLGLEITMVVTTADTDLLQGSSGESCNPTATGSQYCSTTTLHSAVSFRGGN